MKTITELKRIFFTGFIGVVFLAAAGCGKTDLTGKWEVTLTWDECSVFKGEPPPPNIYQMEFKDSKLYVGKEEVGDYNQRPAKRIKLRLTKMKVICYGKMTGKNQMGGEISYYPSSEIYGTWTAVRAEGAGT
ncbi:MAG: hypothetical protein GY950_34060 [bacterium]|nr:hypothetical protein [bacterium]